MFEGVSTGDIVDEECPRRTTIVGAGDGTEGFLAGCVPYLKLSSLFVYIIMGGRDNDKG